jgi:hypothetical protein
MNLNQAIKQGLLPNDPTLKKCMKIMAPKVDGKYVLTQDTIKQIQEFWKFVPQTK